MAEALQLEKVRRKAERTPAETERAPARPKVN